MNKEYLESEESYFLQELVKTYSVLIKEKYYILEIWKSKVGFQLRPNPFPNNFGEQNWHNTIEEAFDRGFKWFKPGLKG